MAKAHEEGDSAEGSDAKPGANNPESNAEGETRSEGDDTPWSEETSVAVWMEVLSCYDALLVAHLALAFAGPIPDSARIQMKLAHEEARRRVESLAKNAHHFGFCALSPQATGTQQLEFLAAARRLAQEAWDRADFLAPSLAKTRGSPPSSWTVPALDAFESIQRELASGQVESISIHGEIRTGPELGELAGYVEVEELDERGLALEFAQHLTRMAGDLVAATDANIVRVAEGTVRTLQAHNPSPDLMMPSMREHLGRSDIWSGLLETAVAMKNTPSPSFHPLAPLIVFVEAVSCVGFSSTALEGAVEARVLPSFVAVGKNFWESVSDYDGPREIARGALRALGHEVGKFTGAERAAAVRRADKTSPNRPRAKGGRRRQKKP